MQKEKISSEKMAPYFNNSSYTCDDEELDLYQFWLILKKRAKIILVTTLVFISLAVIYILIKPPTYKTETTIFPLGGEKSGGMSAILANLPVPLPSTFQSSITVETILKSRFLKERLIQKLNLLPVLFPDLWDFNKKTWKKDVENPPTILDGVEKLDKLMSVSTDKNSGVITLSVEFPKEPIMAYKIATTALEETQKILDEKSWSLAKKHRLFIEQQINEALKKWKLLEKIYADFLQGKIKEVPLIVDEKFINQLLVKNRNGTIADNLDINALKAKLNQYKTKNSFTNISEYKFNYQKLQWQMSLLQNILTTLFQQYEVAKANEIKEQIAFQVIDPPYIPPKDKPYKPKKVFIIAVATISGLFLGIFMAFFIEWLENIKNRYQ